jgi:hypothetical protein
MNGDRWVKIPENNTGFKSISGHESLHRFLEFVTVHRTPGSVTGLYNHGINYDFCVYADHISISKMTKMMPGSFGRGTTEFKFKDLK